MVPPNVVGTLPRLLLGLFHKSVPLPVEASAVQTAQRLTAALYVTLHGDDMNASQHAAAAGQLRDILGGIGAAKAQADAVVSQMPQAAVR